MEEYDKSYEYLCNPITNFLLRNSEMDTYRLRELPNQNENVTHEIKISPPPSCKGKT